MLGCHGNRRVKCTEQPDCTALLRLPPFKQLAGAHESIQPGTHSQFLRTLGSLQSSSGHLLSFFFYFPEWRREGEGSSGHPDMHIFLIPLLDRGHFSSNSPPSFLPEICFLSRLCCLGVHPFYSSSSAVANKTLIVCCVTACC